MMTTGSSITNARSCDRGGEWPYSPFAAQAAVRRGVPFRHCIHGRIDRGRRIYDATIATSHLRRGSGLDR